MKLWLHRRPVTTLRVLLVLSIFMTGAEAARSGTQYVDPGNRFTLELPETWSFRQTDKYLELFSPNESLAVHFYSPELGDWTVDLLMQLQEDALRLQGAGGTLREAISLDGRGELRIYDRPNAPPDQDTTIVGCVVLPKGAVGLFAVLPDDSSVQAIRAILSSIRAPDE